MMGDLRLPASQSDEDRSIMPVFIACAVAVLLIVLTTWRYVAYQPRSAEGRAITPVVAPAEDRKHTQPHKPAPTPDPSHHTYAK